ncbi:MAG: tRNA (N6-threonylcarbamoyladenosine(37)-N6)-methyltransferase TrmO [Candidatus Thorarchaeota archaeon]|nr:tRNA (N6-threonylcarbamoyladenosine(37)-N6)-methyltransferase TrmO [Candidatus Thorarchaeota archaeon]
MQMNPITIKPIGVIRTPFEKSKGLPIQASMTDVEGHVELDPEYVDGLATLDLFSHAILVYWFHKVKPVELTVVPYMDSNPHGVFATRSPSRPNCIGLSTVEIVEINGPIIRFRGADMLDWTPLLDIKPFVPEFDNRENATSGWLTEYLKKTPRKFSDDRFEA